MTSSSDPIRINEIQHFIFCPRQWGLIKIEDIWSENFFTTDGSIKHEHTDDPTVRERRSSKVKIHAMHVSSQKLNLVGICDLVEFIPVHDEDTLEAPMQPDSAPHYPTSVYIPKFQGTFCVVPVEFKRGRPKQDVSDALQLLAQAECLEESLLVSIPYGEIFYFEEHRRQTIEFSDELRQTLRETLDKMQWYIDAGVTPKVPKKPSCKSCSLKDTCLPEIPVKLSVTSYIERCMQDENPA